MSMTSAQPQTGRVCPFCAAPAPVQMCTACGRDTTAPRKVCKTCGKMVPSADKTCWNCRAVFTSELAWKIPVIILIFAAAFALAIVLQLAK
jgi:hypothetical protein